MNFRIEMRGWLEHDLPDSLEAASLAEVAIFAGDICLTEIEDLFSRTIRQTIRVSGIALAIWFVENYWRLRFENLRQISLPPSFEWRMAHELAAIGDGYQWPSLTFLGVDGEYCILELKRTRHTADPGSIRYVNDFHGAVTSNSFENAVINFAETVRNRLFDLGHKNTPIDQIFEDINRERGNADDATFRRIEALLGLDPDENSDLVNSLVKKWSKTLGLSAVEEIAASSGNKAVVDNLTVTRDIAARVSKHGRIDTIDRLREVTTMNAEGPTWARARSVAYEVRKSWSLKGEPVTDRFLREKLEFAESDLYPVNAHLPFSIAVVDRTQGKFGFALAREKNESRRFDISRLIGDCILIEDLERVKPATAATTIRQRFQRAFAAEFLCPSWVVRERLAVATNRDAQERILEDIANEYCVSDRLVRHHLENHGAYPSVNI